MSEPDTTTKHKVSSCFLVPGKSLQISRGGGAFSFFLHWEQCFKKNTCVLFKWAVNRFGSQMSVFICTSVLVQYWRYVMYYHLLICTFPNQIFYCPHINYKRVSFQELPCIERKYFFSVDLNLSVIKKKCLYHREGERMDSYKNPCTHICMFIFFRDNMTLKKNMFLSSC